MQETMQPTDKDYWKHIVTSNNLFGVDLFKTQAMENPSSNVIISPTAVYLLLSMLYNGAAQSSAAQLAAALKFPRPEEINPWNKQLLNYLTSDKPDHDVAIAFALWFGMGIRCHESFVKNCRDFYASAIYGVDFESLISNEQINCWAQTSTKDRIAEVVEPQKPLNGSKLALTTALYFSVPWQSGFEIKNTVEQKFLLVGGGSKMVPMMYQIGQLQYKDDENVQLVKLPFRNSPYYMQVILPRPGKTFGHCIEYLKAPNDCFASVPSDGLMLAMPRFEVEFKADLTRALTQLGIADAFVAGRADLSPIAPALNAAFIGHAAKLKVDEAGNAPPPGVAPMRQMLVDRPFLFSVVDGGTGQVLLTSAVLNP